MVEFPLPNAETGLELQLAFDKVGEIHPILAGVPPHVVGSVLGDLVATWIAGHIAVDAQRGIDKAETDYIRGELIKGHVDLVRKLVALSDLEESKRASEKG